MRLDDCILYFFYILGHVMNIILKHLDGAAKELGHFIGLDRKQLRDLCVQAL